MLFKNQSLKKKLPTCDYKLTELTALIDICERIHEDCKGRFRDDIRQGRFIVEGVSPTDDAGIALHVEDNYDFLIEIFGANGEYLNVRRRADISAADLPHRILKIVVGNLDIYEFKTKKHRPSIHFNIRIDFETIRIFDLITSPTRSTENESSLEVNGINSITVHGIAAELDGFFVKFKNSNYIINSENAYDVMLWLGFLPLLIIYLLKFRELAPPVMLSAPVAIQVIIAIVFLFQMLLLFRLLFNCARWFFPCQELVSQTRHGRKIAKYIYSTAIAGIVSTIAFNIAEWIIGHIWS